MRDVQINRRKFLQKAAAGALLAGSAANSSLPAGQAAEHDCGLQPAREMVEPMGDPEFVRLITLDPAHFHAALVQKQMLAGIAKRAAIYAPLGPDLLAHLKLIEQFNSRVNNPTSWELDIHCSPKSLEEMIAARPGNVVVLAGRNRIKIGKIDASLEAGLNVLSDKPWIIRAEDFRALEAALSLADQKGLVAYDMMTERHEITTILQRELVNDPEVFGTMIPADQDHPGVFMESTHHVLKTVAGASNPRPPFFFDILEQGEGLTDVGTHLVDLVQWTLFPDQALNFRQDIQVQNGKRWATPITAAQFGQITGAAAFPTELVPYVHGDRFDYYCNNQVDYKIRGAQVRLRVLWNWESPAGVDFHHATYSGTNASVEVRQTAKENYRPELFVAPNGVERGAVVAAAVRARIEHLKGTYPGVGCEAAGDELHITIPDRYRVGHEAHFAQVVGEFLKYLKSPQSMPAWERPNMLAKYFVTTSGVQRSSPQRR
ncbi:MAG TPA: putative oxidoreductase C-terminal domain-containing protein [Terriglobia bacterium]|nr:putative oxidoreductase C-terminal domain-containing protein [Terriglobia bacterium]